MTKTAEFDAVDADGNRYRVLEFTPYKEVISDGKAGWIPGTKALMLKNGDPVNLADDGGFEIARNGVRLSRL